MTLCERQPTKEEEKHEPIKKNRTKKRRSDFGLTNGIIDDKITTCSEPLIVEDFKETEIRVHNL